MSQTPNIASIWDSSRTELKETVTSVTFNTMLASVKLQNIENNIATLSCSSKFIQEQVEVKYYNLLKQILDKHSNQSLNLVFNVEETKTSSPVTDLPLFSNQTVNAVEEHHTNLAKEQALRKANISPFFTFETFAVGSTNQLAYAAADAVAQEPGRAYNPLFIWGTTGVGKSHLMGAIGQTIIEKNTDAKVLFSPGEDFTNEIISAIRNKDTMKFKQKYRNIDVLMLDDIQFLAGKDTAQEEFFHTFNAIIRAGGQIIMTADRPPSELTKLEDRLRSRFQAGLIVDVGEPDFELRTAILLIKSKQRGFELPMPLAQQIAEHITSARELEGFLMRLKAALMQTQQPPDSKLISELLGKTLTEESPIRRSVRPNDVIKATADHFEVKITDLKGKSRVARFIKPRHIAMYILRNDMNVQLEHIGQLFNRDHTTIMHAVEKTQKQLGKNPELDVHIMRIRENLR